MTSPVVGQCTLKKMGMPYNQGGMNCQFITFIFFHVFFVCFWVVESFVVMFESKFLLFVAKTQHTIWIGL